MQIKQRRFFRLLDTILSWEWRKPQHVKENWTGGPADLVLMRWFIAIEENGEYIATDGDWDYYRADTYEDALRYIREAMLSQLNAGPLYQYQ